VKRSKDHTRDRGIDRALRRWFARAARPLPWRTSPRDPYRSLLSEIMLQQTQVSRVITRFRAFVERFPTVEDLAAATEPQVLALWSGLGYYSRARNLHAAARQLVADFGGRVPEAVGDLRQLKGVGRYTAGAIASMVYNQREPLVDGNVARVLMRIEGKPFAHASEDGMAWAWKRAAALVEQTPDPAAFNEGLMELGATICTPRSPACDRCPLCDRCTARARGEQDRIPRPKPAATRKTIHCAAVILADARGRVLLERRPGRGMWAGLWQAPTLEAPGRIEPGALAKSLGLRTLRPAGEFTHTTTHRQIRFCIYAGRLPARCGRILEGRTLTPRADLDTIALGTAQRRAIMIGLGA
jgi:A/G-specific adenine glycosylase